MICSLWWTFICENQPRWIKGALSESRWRHISSCCPQTSCERSWGGFFPCWGAETLWLQLVLLPRAGLTGQFSIPACAPYKQHQHRGGWEGSPLEHSADLTECQAEFASHPFLPSPWYLLQGKPSVLQHFYLCLGKQMKQSYCDACGLMLWSTSSCLLHANLVLTV